MPPDTCNITTINNEDASGLTKPSQQMATVTSFVSQNEMLAVPSATTAMINGSVPDDELDNNNIGEALDEEIPIPIDPTTETDGVLIESETHLDDPDGDSTGGEWADNATEGAPALDWNIRRSELFHDRW